MQLMLNTQNMLNT